MDADIYAATTSFELDKIKAQDYRNALASQKADRTEQLTVAKDFQAWFKAQYAALPDQRKEQLDLLFLKLAEKYMTTSTATVDATILADATNDAKRLDAAFKAASAVLPP